MAGSYRHAVTDDGRLRNAHTMTIATETQGDAYETIEEMYGMIWVLATLAEDVGEHPELGTNPSAHEVVEWARRNYRRGIDEFSPGRQEEFDA